MGASEVHELLVKIRGEGIDETTESLDEMSEQFEESAEQAEESAGVMEDFANKFEGAMNVVVGGLAVAASGLLSQVPVIGELASGLFAIINSLALKIDETLRPALGGVTNTLFNLAGAIDRTEGVFSSFIGIVGTVGASVAALEGAVLALNAAFGLGLSSVLGTIVGFLGGPLTAAILGIVGLVGVLAAAWTNNWFGIRDIVTGVISTIQDVLGDFVSWATARWDAFTAALARLWRIHGAAIVREAKAAFQTVRSIITRVLNFLQPFIRRAVNVIAFTVLNTFDTMLARVKSTWQLVEFAVLTAADAILTSIRVILNLIQGDWKGAWSAIAGFGQRTWTRIKETALSIFGAWKTALTRIWTRVKNAAERIFTSMRRTIENIFSNIDLSGIISTLNNIINKAKKAIDKIQSIPDVPDVDVPDLGGGRRGLGGGRPGRNPNPPDGTDDDDGGGDGGLSSGPPGTPSNPLGGFATGGFVTQSGVGVIHQGETIVPEAQVTNRGRVKADVDRVVPEAEVDRSPEQHAFAGRTQIEVPVILPGVGEIARATSELQANDVANRGRSQ